jgi:hypothetical protein
MSILENQRAMSLWINVFVIVMFMLAQMINFYVQNVEATDLDLVQEIFVLEMEIRIVVSI